MQRSPVYYRVERDTEVPWSRPYSSPTPSPHTLLCSKLQLSRKSSFRGGGKHLLRPLPFLSLGLSQEGSAGHEQETEKERKKGNSYQLPGKTLSWKYYALLRVL